jgi:putative ABC transport system permease protein
MFSLTIKGLWAHKLRYALTGLAVVLGVAFMAGTMVLTDTMKSTFNSVFESANDGTDVIVQRSGALDGEFEQARARVESGVVEQVAAVGGVAAASGSIQGFAQLVHDDGTVTADDGLGITIGSNWIEDERLNPFTLETGRAPVAASEAVLDQRTAEDEGWALGDDFTVLAGDGPTTFTLVGTATYGAIDGIPGSTMVATTDETAQALFAEPGTYDNVLVAAEETVTSADLADRIVAQVATEASGLEAITGEQDTADKQADFAQDVSFFNSFLMAFAYVALFVGTFIIYNTFSIVVAQRMKDLAMLRAIGARRGQVLRSVVLESVVVGVTAAAVGLVAGIGLSFGLRALLSSVGLEIPSGDLVLSSGTVITAFAVGLVTSVLSAIVPAFRASRVRPIAALRDVAIDRSGVSVSRIVAGLAVTALGVVSFAAGVTGDGDGALSLLGLGAVVTILGVFVLGPVLVRPAIRLLGAPAAATGVTGAYARENARRTPKRTAATASALMIGVALVGFITILASSTNASIESAVDTSFRADYVIDSGSVDRGFAPAIEDDLRAAEEVDTLAPVRTGVAGIDGSTVDIMATDTSTIDGLYDLEVSAGDVADVTGDSVAVALARATDSGYALGDTIPVQFADGSEVSLVVRAIYDATLNSGEFLLDLPTFEAHVPDQFDSMLFVSIDDGVTAEVSRAAIDEVLAAWPNATLEDQAEFKQSVTKEIDVMLNLIYGLLALAVVISLIGIANTLALSVHERTRELGLLRAVGMHRSQLRRAVRWEALLISALGAALGAVLAVGGAWGIVQALDSEGVTELVVPGTRLAIIVGFAGLAGVLAATGPARRASKLDVLEALASE